MGFKNLLASQNCWTGLEITAREARLVRVDGTGKILNEQTVSLPAGLIKKGRPVDLPGLSIVLREGLPAVRRGRCVLSLPGEALLVRFLALPAEFSEQDMTEAAKYEVLEEIVDLVPEPVVDCQKTVLTVIDTSDEEISQVMAVIISRLVLNDYLAVARELGLKTVAVEPSFLSLLRLCRQQLKDQSKINVLVDTGMDSTWMLVLQGSEIHFCRNIPAGWQELPELQEQLQMAMEFYVSKSNNAIEQIFLTAPPAAGKMPVLQKDSHPVAAGLKEVAATLEEGLAKPVITTALNTAYTGLGQFHQMSRATGAALRGVLKEDL